MSAAVQLLDDPVYRLRDTSAEQRYLVTARDADSLSPASSPDGLRTKSQLLVNLFSDCFLCLFYWFEAEVGRTQVKKELKMFVFDSYISPELFWHSGQKH